jgi:hypothetical protein
MSSEAVPSPLKAVRHHCLWCCNGSSNEVALCPATQCPLWALRFGKRPTPEILEALADVGRTYPLEDPMPAAEVAQGSRTKAIRRRCLDCSGYSTQEVKDCKFATCDLYPYRLGKSPNRVRTLSEEQKQVLRERLARVRPPTG